MSRLALASAQESMLLLLLLLLLMLSSLSGSSKLVALGSSICPPLTHKAAGYSHLASRLLSEFEY